MSAGQTDAQTKRALYWLGDQLIEHRFIISVIVLLITALFGYWTSLLRLETAFNELLPQSHPFVQTHNQYAATFGGANNITVMLQVKDGTIFNPETLSRVFRLTEGLDRVYGINHNQIDSIGHRTTRYIKVAAGGTMRSEPVMLGVIKNDGEAANIRRIVHNSQNIYGLLVSLDDKAALIRANYVEGRLDHRRTFDEVNEWVQNPFGKGWVGALFVLPPADEKVEPGAVVEAVYKDTPAEKAGLQVGDRVMEVNGQRILTWSDPGNIFAGIAPGQTASFVYKRGEQRNNATLTIPEQNAEVYIAGEPRLYGWIYFYANDVFWILVATYLIEWVLRWMYFHDWRGSLRPTLTGVLAAIWGLGFIHLIGFALDPLMLVVPFLITARAVSHAIQMHDRYYEEMERNNWDKRKAIVASFAELFVPTFSGIVADALGVLVIILVPVVMLQKLAITASWWILAITISEMLLNPIVYFYLKAPEPELVLLRERGAFRRGINRVTDFTLSPLGKIVILVAWGLLTLGSAYFVRGLIIGDPTAASPLVWNDSPYNQSHAQIQQTFGGVEPLIVVNEGYDKDAMKDPSALRSMQGLQRFLERDPEVGYSFSLVDILTAVNAVFHELEPKWGVIPNNWVDVGGLFFIFFSSSPPTETAKYVDPGYTTSHVTFFCRNHKGDTIRRIMMRVEEYIGTTYLKQLAIEVAEDKEKKTVTVTKIAEGSIVLKAEADDGSGNPEPMQVGDVILKVGEEDEVHSIMDLYNGLRNDANRGPGEHFLVQRGGDKKALLATVPWKAAYRLAGGLIGVLAAANEELVRNDLLMNILGFGTIYLILLFTYRSFAAGIYMLAPMMISNLFVNAYMSVHGIGVNLHTLPLVTVGVGFGIDYALYIVSRIIEEMRVKHNLEEATKEALCTSGKSVTFTAVTMIMSTALWTTSHIRFDAEMGGLLAIWMGISYVGSQTLLPVLILVFKPKFVLREIPAHVGGEKKPAAAKVSRG
jgi:predicted RND superfamily exporter protein